MGRVRLRAVIVRVIMGASDRAKALDVSVARLRKAQNKKLVSGVRAYLP